jgi:predicted transcriptional regulator
MIRPGGTTEQVFAYLMLMRSYQRKDMIVRATGRTAKAVDWALRFLRREGLIERGQDPRNPRYKTYKAKP